MCNWLSGSLFPYSNNVVFCFWFSLMFGCFIHITTLTFFYLFNVYVLIALLPTCMVAWLIPSNWKYISSQQRPSQLKTQILNFDYSQLSCWIHSIQEHSTWVAMWELSEGRKFRSCWNFLLSLKGKRTVFRHCVAWIIASIHETNASICQTILSKPKEIDKSGDEIGIFSAELSSDKVWTKRHILITYEWRKQVDSPVDDET